MLLKVSSGKTFHWEVLGGSRCRGFEGETCLNFLLEFFVRNCYAKLLQLELRIHENEGELASLALGKLPECSIIKACKAQRCQEVA